MTTRRSLKPVFSELFVTLAVPEAEELVATPYRHGREAEVARELAYRLYTISERKKGAAGALSYNGLVQSRPEIVRLARVPGEQAQSELFV